MSVNRLRTQGSNNARGPQGRLAHAATATALAGVVSSSSPHCNPVGNFWTTSSFQNMASSPMNGVLSEVVQDCSPNDNNANQIATSLAMQRVGIHHLSDIHHSSNGLGTIHGGSTSTSYSSLQDLYCGSAATMHSGLVKAVIGPMEQNHFLQCRGSELDLNFGWDSYISS